MIFFKKYVNFLKYLIYSISFPLFSGKHTVYFLGKIRYNLGKMKKCALFPSRNA